METVLNLSLSIASIYIRHPIICQSCPMTKLSDGNPDSIINLIIKSETFPDDQSPDLQGQLLTPLRQV